MNLLNGIELPALEDGCANKKLLVRFTLNRLIISSLRRIIHAGQSGRENQALFGHIPGDTDVC